MSTVRSTRTGTEAGWVTALRAREAVFRRAPSAHNTQPWVLRYAPDAVHVGVDPARTLPASDPTGRDLLLGLGALVESCLVVAADVGVPVRAVVASGAAVAGGPHVPAVRLVAADAVYATPFTAADVADRRVARGRYAPGPLPGPVLDAVVALAGGPAPVPVPAADLAVDLRTADRLLFATPPVARELGEWLRLHPRHARYRLDGLTDRALALSRPAAYGLGAALAALRTLPVLARAGLPAALAAAGGAPLRPDGTVLVLTAGPDGALSGGALSGADGAVGLVDAGRRLQRTWLALARHGLAVHPLSQLLDCPATAARLARRVGATPLAVFRVGRPLAEPVRSARLPVTGTGPGESDATGSDAGRPGASPVETGPGERA